MISRNAKVCIRSMPSRLVRSSEPFCAFVEIDLISAALGMQLQKQPKRLPYHIALPFTYIGEACPSSQQIYEKRWVKHSGCNLRKRTEICRWHVM